MNQQEIKVWICGRLCAVHGFIESDYSVGIFPHFVVECVTQLNGLEFTAEEHERLFEDDDLYDGIRDAAMEVADQSERLDVADYEWNELDWRSER